MIWLYAQVIHWYLCRKETWLAKWPDIDHGTPKTSKNWICKMTFPSYPATFWHLRYLPGQRMSSSGAVPKRKATWAGASGHPECLDGLQAETVQGWLGDPTGTFFGGFSWILQTTLVFFGGILTWFFSDVFGSSTTDTPFGGCSTDGEVHWMMVQGDRWHLVRNLLSPQFPKM